MRSGWRRFDAGDGGPQHGVDGLDMLPRVVPCPAFDATGGGLWGSLEHNRAIIAYLERRESAQHGGRADCGPIRPVHDLLWRADNQQPPKPETTKPV
jgi:hypothetical protein